MTRPAARPRLHLSLALPEERRSRARRLLSEGERKREGQGVLPRPSSRTLRRESLPFLPSFHREISFPASSLRNESRRPPLPLSSGGRRGIRGKLFSAAQLLQCRGSRTHRPSVCLSDGRSGTAGGRAAFAYYICPPPMSGESLSLLYLLNVCEATIIVCLAAAASVAPGGGGSDFIRNTSCGNITHNELYLCRRQRASGATEALGRLHAEVLP